MRHRLFILVKQYSIAFVMTARRLSGLRLNALYYRFSQEFDVFCFLLQMLFHTMDETSEPVWTDVEGIYLSYFS
jgi:hypothetical protein